MHNIGQRYTTSIYFYACANIPVATCCSKNMANSEKLSCSNPVTLPQDHVLWEIEQNEKVSSKLMPSHFCCFTMQISFFVARIIAEDMQTDHKVQSWNVCLPPKKQRTLLGSFFRRNIGIQTVSYYILILIIYT